MLKIRCPKCGTNLYEGQFTFPRCHHCGANALCCRACVSYDPVRGVCIEPSSPIDTVADPDEMPQCGMFKPKEMVTAQPRRPLGRRFWAFVGAGVVVVLAVLAFAIMRMRAAHAPHELVAHIVSPGDIAAGQPAMFSISVTNHDEANARSVTVRFPKETLMRWKVTPTAPEPTVDEMRGSARYLVYDVPAGGTAQITLAVQTERAGQPRLRIEVMDHRGRTLDLVAGRTDVTP